MSHHETTKTGSMKTPKCAICNDTGETTTMLASMPLQTKKEPCPNGCKKRALTKEECKDEVARIHGHEDWEDLNFHYFQLYPKAPRCRETYLEYENEAMELYANQPKEQREFKISSPINDAIKDGLIITSESSGDVPEKIQWHAGDGGVIEFYPAKEQRESDSDFRKKIDEYFKNTPIEQIKKDWESTKDFDGVGPTVEEFFNSFQPKEQREPDKYIVGRVIFDGSQKAEAEKLSYEDGEPIEAWYLSPQPLKFPSQEDIEMAANNPTITRYGLTYLEELRFKEGANWVIKQMKGESK